MDDAGPRAGRLATFALGVFAFFFLALVQVRLFFGEFPQRPRTTDFANYVAAARVGMGTGWSHIYDRQLQSAAYLPLTGAHSFEWYHTFISPPPVAWLVAPVAWLPLTTAFWGWTVVSAALFGLACWLVAPWPGLPRITALLVGAGCWPVLIAIQFGQITPLIAAAGVSCLVAIRSGRTTAAGLLLVPIVLKPQVGMVLPFALLLAGHRRVFAVWVAGVVVVVIASAASLGPDGVRQYWDSARFVNSHAGNQDWTLAWFLGLGPLATIAEAACVVIALATAWAWRGRDPSTPLIVGGLASLLGAGYHHSIDFPVLIPLAIIQLGRLPTVVAVPFGVIGLTACMLSPRFGPMPLLAFCVTWLAFAGLVAVAFRTDRGRRWLVLGPPRRQTVDATV